MEAAPQPSRENTPKLDAYREAGVLFTNQLALFESRHHGEGFATPSDAVYAFAEFIRAQSESVLAAVRAAQTGRPENQRTEYRREEAAAKLHEFNMMNAATLSFYAEIRAGSEETVKLFHTIFPWLTSIDAWAVRYVSSHKNEN